MKIIRLFVIFPLLLICAGCQKEPVQTPAQAEANALQLELRNQAPDASTFDFIRQAARQGDEDAQITLGLIYAAGHGAAKNYNEAYRWLRRAADEGNDEAREMLVQLSDAMRKNPAQVQSWLENEAKTSVSKMRLKTQKAAKETAPLKK